jgi:hypothetical protein
MAKDAKLRKFSIRKSCHKEKARVWLARQPFAEEIMCMTHAYNQPF